MTKLSDKEAFQSFQGANEFYRSANFNNTFESEIAIKEDGIIIYKEVEKIVIGENHSLFKINIMFEDILLEELKKRMNVFGVYYSNFYKMKMVDDQLIIFDTDNSIEISIRKP